MANLQAALDEFKTEIADLEHKKTTLIRDITGLESKQKFTKSATDKIVQAKVDTQVKYDLRFSELQAKEAELEEKIAIAFEDLEAVEKQKQAAESELETLEAQHEQEIIGHNKRLNSVKNEVKAVEALKNDAGRELLEVNKQISIRQARFKNLDETIRQAELDCESELAELEQLIKLAKQRSDEAETKTKGALKDLQKLIDQVADKKTELDKLEKKHQDFLTYEKRAKVALKARESALLLGEADLINAKRRNPASVLDNLG